jgi:exodeoxyribonuclease X
VSTLIIDTETDQLEDARVVEVAWIDLSNKDKFEQRYNNERPISAGAKATHHIIDKDLIGKPSYSDFKLPDGVEYIVGHKVDFDWGVIGKPDVKRICTLALSRHFYPEAGTHTLGAMMYYLFPDEMARERLIGAHSAAVDIDNCLILLFHTLRENQIVGLSTVDDLFLLTTEDWERVWQVSEDARVPTVCLFGKHRGETWGQVVANDRGYCNWYLKLSDADPYVVAAIRKWT